MKKNKFIAIICVFLCTATSGCADKMEVDDQVYAIAIGADKGAENKIRFTVQYPTYKKDQGGSQQDQDIKSSVVGNTVTSTVEAPSIIEAINLLATFTSRRISLVHTKMIIFSEDFARDGIAGFLQPIARYRESRRIMQILVCKGTAEEFIKQNTTLIGQGLSKAIELRAKQSMDTGFFPNTPFHSFYRNMLSPYCQPYAVYAGINDFSNLKSVPRSNESPLYTEKGYLPGTIPRRGDLKIELAGTAVFNGDKMVGTLNTYETRYFQMVTGVFKRGIMTIEDKHAPGKAIILDLRPGRPPKVEAHLSGDKAVINYQQYIEADIVSVQSRYPYEDPKKVKELDNQLKEDIEMGITKLIKKTQEELKTDIFGFGYKVARNFKSVPEFEKYNWLAQYPKADIKVDIITNVRRTGLMVRSAKVRYGQPAED